MQGIDLYLQILHKCNINKITFSFNAKISPKY